MAQVKLLGFWYSPFTHRVEWALKIKGVKYEYIEEDRYNKSSLLLESNPVHKKTPVLIHNGKSIAESMVIVEYIDETFEGPSILPKDPYDRALARFWAKFLDDKGEAMVNTFLRRGEEQEKGKEEVYEMLKVLDNELKDKKFFVGDKFGFGDMAANFMGLWLGVFEEGSGVVVVTSQKFPNFYAWRDEYINCSQIKEYLPPRDEWGTLVNGKLHWTTGTTHVGVYNPKDVTCIDLADEKWRKVVQPCYREGDFSYMLSLGMLGGDLALFCNYPTHADMWVMKEYEVKESWTKMFTINYHDDPAGCLNQDREISNCGSLSKANIYIESLVWPFPQKETNDATTMTTEEAQTRRDPPLHCIWSAKQFEYA
ncbi:hypothetical protein RND71_021439 [Anisodus tanguticus]|uniref:Probable glutathione S-transferase n=1 Tax=Anisodus tanguticus TaxID=243964 RepID=A0AAE1RW49_9SOLA|nr:hypothetical protein RND71_021439 [Anisodus tanguticus]